jgi:uncharacterized protein (DUF305 family)
MIPHHQGAVDMCGVLTSGPTHGYAVEASLAAMCVNVVSSQSSEIATMETWLTSRAKELTAPCAGSTGMAGCGAHLSSWSSKQFERVNAEMHHGMAIKFNGNPNYDFVKGMIAHHQGAIDMCKVLTNTCGHGQTVEPGLLTLCSGITTAQTTEIATLTKWLVNRDEPTQESCPMGDSAGGGCGDVDCWASKEFIEANSAMHGGMAIKYTGDPNIGQWHGQSSTRLAPNM